jgi:murein DD-endopeptidase MepM/ murein hydrolase activator NlpD
VKYTDPDGREPKSPETMKVYYETMKRSDPITNEPKLENWPIASGRVSSEWGKRAEPVAGTGTFHGGIDLATPNGTPVLATSKGKVSQVTDHAKYGTMVVIEMENGLVTADMHLSSTDVKKGDSVTAGQQTGKTGITGEWTDGGHDHFSVWTDRTKVPDFISGKTMVIRETVNPRDVLPKQPDTIK